MWLRNPAGSDLVAAKPAPKDVRARVNALNDVDGAALEPMMALYAG